MPHAAPPVAEADEAADLPLRERKKLRMRRHIVDVAAALFHQRGYDAVTVADVARAAEVGEQTVYNYFVTKEGLVFDEADAFAARFAAMVTGRRAGEPVTASVRREAHGFLDRQAAWPKDPNWRGGMPYLIAANPAVRRGWLAWLERYSRIVADTLVADSGGALSAATAGVLGWTLMSVFAVIVDSVSETVRSGGEVAALTARLRPEIDAAIDLLERGLAADRSSP